MGSSKRTSPIDAEERSHVSAAHRTAPNRPANGRPQVPSGESTLSRSDAIARSANKERGKNTQPVLRYLFPAYLIIATVLLVVPLDMDSPAGVAGKFSELVGLQLSTAGHVLLYATGAVIAFASASPGALSITSLAVHGPLMELVQSFVPMRTAELSDIVADWAGLLVGALLACLLRACTRRAHDARFRSAP